MTKLPIQSAIDALIANQWNRNARRRSEELESGQDETYKDTLCPVMLKLLNAHSKGRVVIDAGCGVGYLSNYLSRYGFSLTGVDFASECIAIAQQRFPSLELLNKGIAEFSFERPSVFDACVANMLFHNVPDIYEAATAIHRLLKPNGVLVGCIPHPEHWFDRKCRSFKRTSAFGVNAYLAPFKIRGSAPHPAPFVYFRRPCLEYWHSFSQAGFSRVEAVSFESVAQIPDDIVFFTAEK